MSRHAAAHTGWKLWGWPIVLGVITAIGLVTALFSDGGTGDVIAWITLGAICVVGLWFGWLRRRSDRDRPLA